MSARRESGGIRRIFRLSISQRVPEDVDAELRFHIDGYADELVAQGMTRADAEAEARRRFGDVHRIQEECTMIDHEGERRRARGERLGAIARDIRHAARSLGRAPAFTVIAAVTLALGIGAAAAIFALVDRVVLHPLPYDDPSRLVFLSSPVPGVKPGAEWGLSQAGYFYFRKENRSFDDIGLYSVPKLTLVTDGGAERVQGGIVTASALHVLRLAPALGRAIGTADDQPGAAPVVMLGYDFWRQRFGGDPGVVGRMLDLGGHQVQVVGVMRRGAMLPDVRVDIWLPMQLDPMQPPVNAHMQFDGAIARLRPGVGLAAAQADLARLTRRLTDVFPTVYPPSFMEGTRFTTKVTPLRDHVVGSTARVLWIVLASVGLVLVIAGANVANLFLVRAEARRRETAIRGALGAGRADLLGHWMTESLLLALGAGVLGVALASALLHAFLAVAPRHIPRLSEVSLGWPAIGLALGISLVAGALFGCFPLLYAGRDGVDVRTLREGGRGLSTSRRQHAMRGALVIGQVALALVLLAAAGLLVQSYRRLAHVQPGFDPSGVVAVDIDLPNVRYHDYESVMSFWRQLLDRLRTIPGVRGAGATTDLPLAGGNGCASVFAETRPAAAAGTPDCVPVMQVTPGYFRAMGIPVDGHAPDWREMAQHTDQVVVSRSLARRFWPGERAIGQGLKGNGRRPPYYHVSGIAGDVRAAGLDEPPTDAVYFPMLPAPGTSLWQPPNYMSVVVRAPGVSEEALAGAIRRELRALDPTVPIANYRSMERVVADSMERVSFTMFLLGIAAAMALVLSAVGMYGVISYLVSQRRPEIGIRVALGAPARRVGALVVAQSARLAVAGVVLGLIGAVAATRVLRSLLFGVSPTDPATLVAAGLLLVTIAALAAWAPARRAASVDPMEVLRE